MNPSFLLVQLLCQCILVHCQFDEEFRKLKERLTVLEVSNESCLRNQVKMQERIDDLEEKLTKISNQKWTMEALIDDINIIEFNKDNVTCETLKSQGYLKSGYYILKGPLDSLPRISACDMQATGTASSETLLGFVQTTKYQVMFQAYEIFKRYRRFKDTIVLTQIEADYGHDYNKNLGEFTVPISGNYTFKILKTGYANNKTASADFSLSAKVNDSVVKIVKGFKVDLYQDMLAGGRGYSWDLVSNFELSYNLTLKKFDVVTIATSTPGLTIGRHGMHDKITWSGSLISPINDTQIVNSVN